LKQLGEKRFMKWPTMFFALAFCAVSAWSDELGSRLAASSQESQLVRDLRAVRKGDKVTLTWTQPRDPANQRYSARHLGIATLCRNISSKISDSGMACQHAVRQVNLKDSVHVPSSAAHARSNTETTVRLIDILPEGPDDSDQVQFAVYKIELRDDRGRSAGFSNSVAVPLAPLLPPKGLHSDLDVRGVYLIWEEETEHHSPLLKFDYRIYRREKGSSKRITVPYLRAVIHTSEGERWSAVDADIEWEKTYLYSITPMTRVYSQEGKLIAEIEGDDSAPLEVLTHDVFAPAVPEKLLAIVGHTREEKFVDLLWAPNAEKDISGYNVYRREENGQPVRLSSLPVTMLSFQDVNVSPGQKYFYSISALDVRGNEGARSQEISAVVPSRQPRSPIDPQ
jgi:hypothetical protein